MSQPVYLVDASIYVFQAHFSRHSQECATDGRDLSAFLGYAHFLLRLLRQARPLRIAAAFDESLFCGFRHQLYSAYKANRELPDESLARQLRACAQLTELMGVTALSSRVYEADDIIGILAARMRQHQSWQHDAPATISIVTRDKDLAQLLRTRSDHLWDFSGGSRRFSDDIILQYGIAPQQFPDYLGLVGDTVDRIPGVPGIGPVAATCLLRHFGSMTVLYENLDEVVNLAYRGAARGAELLRRHEAAAWLSKKLATIVEDIDSADEAVAAVSPSELLWRAPQIDSVRDLLEEEGVERDSRERYLHYLIGLQASRMGDRIVVEAK